MRRCFVRYVAAVLALLLASSAVYGREIYNISRDWKFFTYAESRSYMVNLPHQWNTDALGGKSDYYRGVGNYMRYIEAPEEWRDKRVMLRCGAANITADVLVNGRYVGRHQGGSSAFVFEIGPYLNYNGRDLVWIIVNNTGNIDVMPTAGDEVAYGGLYRDVHLVVVEPTHISLDHYGSEGVYVHTKGVSSQEASGEVEIKIASGRVESATVQLSIAGPDGDVVYEDSQKVRTVDGTTSVFVPFELDYPILWHGTLDPALYTFSVKLFSGGVERDEVVVQSGFRYYEVGEEGFLLNGEKYVIKGVMLHRDRPLNGTAVDEREVLEDVEIALEMGANAIRVVGGSHHPRFYDICDRKGVIVINDLPFVGSTTINGKGFFNTEAFRKNGLEQLQEMVYQHYNHPSVMVWNLFSEIELRGESPVAYVRELHRLAKRINPTRFTSGWSNQDGEINFITDLVVWSHTYGWQDGQPSDIAVWQEQLREVPEWRALRSAVSYKCGGSPFHQSDVLQRPLASSNWHPERWQTLFHETYLDSLQDDKMFWGTFVDCLFDYASSEVHRSLGGISDMGVVSFNRQVRKDSFYRYKAAWNKSDMFIHIAEKRWARRSNQVQDIKVYTNLPEAELTVNGLFMGVQKNENGVIVWTQVKLERGLNEVEASARGLSDHTTIEIPHNYSSDM